jgi:hypothetical protein
MNSSTKMDVSYDPREITPRQRRSSRLNRKHLGSHCRKSSTSTEVKTPKIVKSSSSVEKPTLETLHSPNNCSPKFMKSHKDCENSKSKSSSKISFWGPPYLSPEIEKLFNTINLSDNSKSLIIFINLCKTENMIHLFNLQLNELSSLFSRKDLRDSSFKNTIIKVLCLGKSSFTLIK